MLAVARVQRAFAETHDAVIDETARDRRLGLAFGQNELRVLKVQKTLSKGPALADIGDGVIQRGLHDGHALDGDDQPLLRQFLHQLIKALAFFAAQQVFDRHADIVEEEFGGVAHLHPDLVEVSSATETRRVGRIDQQQRDSLSTRLGIRLGDDDDQLGQLAVGDEGLLPLQDVMVPLRGAPWFGCPSDRIRRPVRSWRPP